MHASVGVPPAVVGNTPMGGHVVPWHPGPFPDDNSNGPTSHPTMESIRMYMDQLNSDDPTERLQGTTMLRRLWCENQQPLDPEVASEVVPRLATILLNEIDFPKLQYEAAWALGSAVVPETSFIPTEAGSALLQRVLDFTCLDLMGLAVAEMAAWAIGTLSAASPSVRDHFFSLGAFIVFRKLLQGAMHSVPPAREGLVAGAAWGLAGMCQGKRPRTAPLERLLEAAPLLVRLLASPHLLVVANAANALFHISDIGPVAGSPLIFYGALEPLVRLLPYPDERVQLPALKAIGNFVSHDDASTARVVAAGALPHFRFLLCHTDARIRREVCWTLSNVCAGTQDQVQAVIDEGLIEPLLVTVADSEYEVRKEALWAITTVTGHDEHIHHLVAAGMLDVICDCGLDPIEPERFLCLGLKAIYAALARQADVGGPSESNLPSHPYADALHLNGGRLKIEALKHHNSRQVVEFACEVLGSLSDSTSGEANQGQREEDNDSHSETTWGEL